MSVYQLPDLARMRALEGRVRSMSDDEVADFLCTDDGQWLFVECPRHMADDVARRLMKIVAKGLPEGAIFALLGVTPTRLPKEGA